MGDRVRNRHDRLEPKVPIVIAGQDGPPVWTITARILHVVEALRVCLPDIHLRALQGVPGFVANITKDKAGLTIRVARDRATIVNLMGIVGMKRSEDCPLRGALWLGVIHRVNQKGNSQNIAKKDEFLGSVSSPSDEVTSI